MTMIRSNLLEIVAKIQALKAYTARTGFKTTRSQNEILQALNGDDLATVLVALENDNENDNGK